MIDHTDWEIIQCLQSNSRLQWKEIGEKVHLTGQAVAARIRKLEDLGVIEGFTVKLNPGRMGKSITALITVFMKTNNHEAFQQFVRNKEAITEAHRISGEGCYWLKAHLATQEELNQLLDEILPYGNYRLNISICTIKQSPLSWEI